MNISGGAAIVTGSATGVGAAAVRLLASKGCNVVVNYTKSEAEASATAAACEALGVQALLIRADVSKDEDCKAMVQAAMDKWGRIDALINNAGRTKAQPPGDLDALNAQDFHDVYAVNLIGAYQMVRAVAPHMKAAGNGSIVNMSALGALTGEGSSMAYAASKGALNSLTLSLARQLKPEIRVNAVCPGFIQTRWMENVLGSERYAERVKEMAETTPVRKAATAEEIAEILVWFIDGTDLMTGEVMKVDYGLRFGTVAPPGAGLEISR
ncbi:MAG: SDR family oxidoreductase [Rhodospirillales bacterium]|nr:SDR family oxidoreductase [Rhodospirillales bacterium]